MPGRGEDLAQLSTSLAQLVPLGLRVQQSEIRDKLGLSDPDDDSDLLRAPAPLPQAAPEPKPALQSQQQPARHPAEAISEQLTEASAPAVAAMNDQIEVMLGQAEDLHEFRAMLSAAFGTLDQRGLAALLAQALAAAGAAGRADLVEESDA